jgi:hypothetical protein
MDECAGHGMQTPPPHGCMAFFDCFLSSYVHDSRLCHMLNMSYAKHAVGLHCRLLVGHVWHVGDAL